MQHTAPHVPRTPLGTFGACSSLGLLLNVAEGWHSEASWVSELHKHVWVLSPRQKSSVQLGSGEGSLTMNKHSKFGYTIPHQVDGLSGLKPDYTS